MPAEHQRVFFIEEKPARRQRVFFIEEKARQTPEPRGFSFIVEKKPYQDQSASGARNRHVFCAVCPYRPGRSSVRPILLYFPGSNSRKHYQSKEGLAVLPRSIYTIQTGFRLAFRDLSSRTSRLDQTMIKARLSAEGASWGLAGFSSGLRPVALGAKIERRVRQLFLGIRIFKTSGSRYG